MLKRKRLLSILGMFVIALLALTACSGSGGSSSATLRAEQNQQTKITQQLEKNQPIPQLNYSQLRQNLIEIKLAEAKGVQTTSFFFQYGDKNPVYQCPSIGAPIDASDQLTNPNQVVHDNYPNDGAALVIDQMDPTGEYSTGGSNGGTYVLCLGADGQAHAMYWEGQVMSVFAPATWNQSTGQVQITGPASFNFSESKGHR